MEVRSELLQALYRALDSASSPGQALSQAMLEVKERHEHPFYWASFVLVGDPG